MGAIEADGYFDEEIKILRGQIKLRERQRDISQRLETARAHMEASEYPLVLEEIEAALEIDPESVERAVCSEPLRAGPEKSKSRNGINWLKSILRISFIRKPAKRCSKY